MRNAACDLILPPWQQLLHCKMST